MIFNEMIIEAVAGTHIDSFKKEMEELSKKYKCAVKGKFNGDTLICTYDCGTIIWKGE